MIHKQMEQKLDCVESLNSVNGNLVDNFCHVEINKVI